MVYGTYKRQRIVHYHLQGYKAPTIAKLLVEDECKAVVVLALQSFWRSTERRGALEEG